MAERILRQAEVQKRTGLGRTTLYRRMKAGEFPLPRQIGGGLIGWLESEVDEWIRSRPVATEGGKRSGAAQRRVLE